MFEIKKKYTNASLSLSLGLLFSSISIFELFKEKPTYESNPELFSLLMFSIIAFIWSVVISYKNHSSQERLIKDVLDSLSDSLMVCEASGKIKYFNRAFSMTYNESQTIEDLFGISDLTKVVSGKNLEFKLINKNGELHRVSLVVHLLQAISSNRERKSYIVSIRNIEELRKKETIIEIQKGQLFEASKLSSLGEMASGFAHEINNPLAIIIGKLTLIEREVKKDYATFDKDVILKHLLKCKETVTRITKIISGLRNISHFDSGEVEEVAIEDLVEDPINMANLKMSGKGIDFKVELNSLEKEKIICNKIQIGQVLINLLANSIFEIESQPEPWLHLKVEFNNFGFKFTIMDSGKGISTNVQSKMFEPMYTTKPVGKGTGLGLSISRSIVELHSGTLVVDNDCPNTSFVVTLPKKIELKMAIAS